MTISAFLGSRLSGESFAAGATVNIAPTCSVEDAGDLARGTIYIGEDGTISKAFLRVSANSLSANGSTFTLQKNGTDQSVVITIDSADGAGFYEDTSNSFTVSAGDEVGWEFVGAAGTGSVTITMLGFWFTPDTSGNCVTFLSTFATGDDTVENNTAHYPIAGKRDFQGTETDSQVKAPFAGTIRRHQVAVGTNNHNASTSCDVRAEASALTGVAISVPASTGQDLFQNSSGTDTISKDDEINYRVSNSGTGAYNHERSHCELVYSGDKMAFIGSNGSATGLDVASALAYLPLAGEQGASTTTESAAQFVFRQSGRLHDLRVRIDDNNASQNGNTIRVRKNGADTDLLCRFNTSTGDFENTEDVVDVSAGDAVCLKVDDGSGSAPSGTSVDIKWTSIIFDATGAGGGVAPSAPTFAVDSQQDFGSVGASPASFTSRPGEQAPTGVLLYIVQQGSSSDDVTAVTYGGTAMSRTDNGFAQDTSGEEGATYAYFLGSSIPEGNQTVTITHGGNGTKYAVLYTYKGGADTEVNTDGKIEGDTANPGVALDTGATTAHRTSAIFSGLGNRANVNDNTGYTTWAGDDFGSQVCEFTSQDSAGSGSSTAGFAASSDDVALVSVAIAEAAVASGILPQMLHHHGG